MPKLSITANACATLIGARALSESERKAVKAATFGAIKTLHSIPKEVKLKVEIDDADSPDYRVLKDKAGVIQACTDGGRWIGAWTPPYVPTPLPVPVTTYRVIDQSDLLSLLRDLVDAGDADDVTMPANVDMMFADDGNVYFRA